MNNKTNTKKSKRLVSAGVFIALYFVVFAVIGSCCMPIPPLYLCMTSIIALVAAPVYMMLLAKAPMHGPIFIAAILPCLFLLLQGNIWIVILTGITAGILAEITAGIGKFRDTKWNVISYVFFSQNLLGGFLPIWVMREYYFTDTLERGMSADFCNTLEAMTPIWVLLLMIAGTVVFALIGCVVAKKMFKKHFEKAGMV
ncbi:MAG: MptD family putative ECF transporter S component [Lachnospiraceae bacterium]